MPYISIESGKLTQSRIGRLTATASGIIHIPEQFLAVIIKGQPDERR